MRTELHKLLKYGLLLQTAGKHKASDFVNQLQVSSKYFDAKRFQDLLEKKEKLLPTEKLETWQGELPRVIEDLKSVSGFEGSAETNKWVEEVINYNVLHGKGIGAIQIILADQYLCNDNSSENTLSINRLAWMMELAHASACTIDDVLDESETRRDRLCWYKVNNNGARAFGDGWFLFVASYELFRKHFSRTAYYPDLAHLMTDMTHLCMYGESRDVRNALQKNYQLYNLEFYKSMMDFKNGYYTFYVPVATIMFKNGVRDEVTHEKVEKLCLDIGFLFAMQDDFMDCFVDPTLTGKIGTDIQDGKCSWLIVNALDKSSQKQRRLLLENYGSKDPSKVERVKELYMDIGIPELYKNTENSLINEIVRNIGKLSLTRLQPLFYDILGFLYGRVR